MSYDSYEDTMKHIDQVQRFLGDIISNLRSRSIGHDASKLLPPEKTVFDEYTPKLAGTIYASAEYKEHLHGMSVGLKHHYETNDHHPEHYPNGIQDMSLLAVIEMLADWKAATLRTKGGDLDRSIRQNASRFGYGSEIERLLRNTARELNWL